METQLVAREGKDSSVGRKLQQTQTSCCPCSSPNPPSLSPAVWNTSQPCSSSRPTSPKKTDTKSKTLCQRHWPKSQPPTRHRFSPKSRSNETSMTGSTERCAFLTVLLCVRFALMSMRIVTFVVFHSVSLWSGIKGLLWKNGDPDCSSRFGTLQYPQNVVVKTVLLYIFILICSYWGSYVLSLNVCFHVICCTKCCLWMF